MKIAIASDHAGYALKKKLKEDLTQWGHEVLDLGVHSLAPADYPDYAKAVSEAVATKTAERGLVVCGSGVGATVAANKVPGARACVCHDTFSARQGVEDDDLNILCLGSRVIGEELAQEVVRAFLSAHFSNAERHLRRLNKVIAIEKEFSK
jgi:ribose 5-phosphate isomerase B